MNMKKFLDQLPDGGIISVIGSGGKTTCMRALAALLPGTKLLCTTTHIFPFQEFPLVRTDFHDPAVSSEDFLSEAAALISMHQTVCIGTTAPSGKLRAPSVPFSALSAIADYLLVEADGSKRLPLKAHRQTEPVIPELSAYTICVTGLSGMDQPIRDVCHCSEFFCALTDSSPTDLATPERIATLLNRENLADLYLFNQADLAKSSQIQRLLSLMEKPAMAVTLKDYIPVI